MLYFTMIGKNSSYKTVVLSMSTMLLHWTSKPLPISSASQLFCANLAAGYASGRGKTERNTHVGES